MVAECLKKGSARKRWKARFEISVCPSSQRPLQSADTDSVSCDKYWNTGTREHTNNATSVIFKLLATG